MKNTTEIEDFILRLMAFNIGLILGTILFGGVGLLGITFLSVLYLIIDIKLIKNKL